MENAREEYRKKRVKRIKRMIVTFVIILLLLPTVLSIFLMIKVFSLQKQIEQIAAGKIETRQTESGNVVQAKEKTAPASPGAVTESAVKAEQKKVYLTFDDGPGTQTSKILDVLKKEKVKATFFVTGKEDVYSKKIYKRIVREGHTLGMHSYSHIYGNIYNSAEDFRKDVEKQYKLLYKVTGVYPEFYRFPGGSGTKEMKVSIQELIPILEQKNLSYLDWNVISPEAKNAKVTKKQMVSGILEGVSAYDTSIVLLYDVADKPMTAKALSAIIKELKKENYELLPIDENTVPIRHNQ